MRPTNLVSHPCAPSPVGVSLKAGVCRLKTGGLTFRYIFRAEAAASSFFAPLFFSRANPPFRRTNRLWEHTCFEAFLASEKQSAYREFNFSPSGDWAAYDFSDYRRGGTDAPVESPEIYIRARPLFLELCATVARGGWEFFSDEMRIGLSAVVEAPDGLTYWALRHSGERPDFHNHGDFLWNFVH
jgi:hypothetical protein